MKNPFSCVDSAVDYRLVFNSEEGKRVLHDLMKTHSILSTTTSKELNVNEMLVKEGERRVVLRILSILNIDPEDMRKRIQEHLDRAKEA